MFCAFTPITEVLLVPAAVPTGFDAYEATEFITLPGGAAAWHPLLRLLTAAPGTNGRSQQAAMPVIGLLSAEWLDAFTDRLRAFHRCTVQQPLRTARRPNGSQCGAGDD